MSKLIVPSHIAEEQQKEAQEQLPEGIVKTLELLSIGARTGNFAVLRRTNADSADEGYDLAVVLEHPITGQQRAFPVARLMPQHPKQEPDGPDVPTVQAPAAVD